MKKSAFLLCIIFVFALAILSATAAHGQTVEPSYEVSLQLLVGSNDGGSSLEVPQNLSTISRQLKAAFPFSNYRLAHTLVSRVSNTGMFEYKSVGDLFERPSDGRQAFFEWSMFNVRNMPTAKGPSGFQAQSFRFGARVPVVTGNAKDDAGKLNPIINYESIGLSLSKVGVPENVPTFMGTVNLPGAGGTIFLVVTIKSVDL